MLRSDPIQVTFANWSTQTTPNDPLDRKFSYKEVYGNNASLYANNSLDFDKIVDIDAKTIDYFDIARNFIGVNKITTNSSLTKNKLEKTKVFQEAGQTLIQDGVTNIVNGDFDADLSNYRCASRHLCL